MTDEDTAARRLRGILRDGLTSEVTAEDLSAAGIGGNTSAVLSAAKKIRSAYDAAGDEQGRGTARDAVVVFARELAPGVVLGSNDPNPHETDPRKLVENIPPIR
jgi:hypothetical protein